MDEPKQAVNKSDVNQEVAGQADTEAVKSSLPPVPQQTATKKLDVFKVGDLVKVITRDPKENKVHATPFEGVVISSRGTGDNKTFTVRRVGAMKVAIERIFPLKSPTIEKIQVIKSNLVSQAKLYYLRSKTTKK